MADLPVLPTRGGNPCLEHACSACCHDIEMLLTEEDLARLRHMRPDEDFWFEAEDGYLQLRTKEAPPAPGAHAAPGASPRPCWFLDERGRCSVWEARPAGCRLYPAVWDEGLREAALDADYCPHTDDFRLPRSSHDATRRLADRLAQERTRRLAGRGV